MRFKGLTLTLLHLLFSVLLFGQIEGHELPFGLRVPSLLDQISPANEHIEFLTSEIREQTAADPILVSQALDINWEPGSESWIQYDEKWIFISKIATPGAMGGGIILDNIKLNPGDKFFIYDIIGDQIYGPYNQDDIVGKSRFFPGLLKGDQWLIEVISSDSQKPDRSPFRVARIDMVPEGPVSALGFDDALPCQINVKCPEGEGYEDEEKSVARILMVLKEGMGWCSGALLNNTANDGTPYILTAFHCQDGYTPEYDLWRFDFNYTSLSCTNPAQEPSRESYTGAHFHAGRRESDFLLLELYDEIAPGQDVWFSGWNRSTQTPSSAAMIHHPAGDIKKISLEENTVIIQNSSLRWNNGTVTPSGHHFQVILDKGSMEPGSSGAPLFDQNGRVVAQLHGGNADCDTKFLTYHGRFTRSWSGGGTTETRLSDWLDPLGTGPSFIDGMSNPNTLPSVSISGTIVNARGIPITNVEVSLEGTVETTTLTDANGQYSFFDLPSDGTYQIKASKDDFYENGVTAQDISVIRRHLLGISEFQDPYALQAADTNGSGTVSAADVVPIIRLILGLNDKFDAKTSWTFDPPQINIVEPDKDQDNIDFTGVKTGDPNHSANPRL